MMKGTDLHPKDHSIQLFTDALNEGWGAHLEQTSTKGLWSDGVKKRLHINVLELKAVSLAHQSFKNQCQNQRVLVATDNSTVVAYINKQGGTHSAEMCALLWKIMTWCHHYVITLKARHIPGCLNVVSLVTDHNAWDIDALNINWLGLTAYAYPLHRVIQKVRQSNRLIIIIAPGWPGKPWFWDLVQLSTEIPLELPVSTTLLN